MTDNTLAALKDVTRTYGRIAVLDAAALNIKPGLTAIVGPNGSGKSTLLGVLAGVIEPTTGRVWRPDSTGTKPVGYLPQQVPFRSGFTARETLAFYARLADADPDSALDAVGLADAAHRRVEALSGGMRRLLGIAQATLGDPSLVVLDEPTSGLDPGMRERAFDTAAAKADDATAVVVSSHDLGLVDAYADHVVVLARGRVVAAGDPDALCDEYGVDDMDALYRAIINGADPDREADEAPVSDGEVSEGVHVPGVSDR